MDQELKDKMAKLKADAGKDHSGNIDAIYAVGDDLAEFSIAGSSFTHKLKPLQELYGKEGGKSGGANMSLLFAIEQELVNLDRNAEELTDAEIAKALSDMSMSPEVASEDLIIQSIQCRLRLLISIDDFSRQEIRQAIRKVAKSVARHENGKRGYIDFIVNMIPE